VTIVNLEEYRRTHESSGRKFRVLFCSAVYQTPEGERSISAEQIVETYEDFESLMQRVKENGVGIVGPDGVYRLIPWPCAAVEIRPVD